MTPREVQLQTELQACQAALSAAQRENVLLRQKLDALARRLFGVSESRQQTSAIWPASPG